MQMYQQRGQFMIWLLLQITEITLPTIFLKGF